MSLATYDVERIRKDFPILSRRLHTEDGGEGVPVIYLDSANTSQKPQVVIDAISEHFARHNANVARAVHTLGSESTLAYEAARDAVAGLIGAPSRNEVIFTKNSSEALNLVAYSLGNSAGRPAGSEFPLLGPGDEVVISEMEHHSNIVPWQLLCQRTGATLRWFRITDDGRLDLSEIDTLINERTRIVSYVHQSNILGTQNPVEPIVARARQVGALVMLDASQSVPHMPVNVADLGVDFIAFTSHKMVGPTGIGVLWGRADLLNSMPPFLGGGEMIETVSMDGSTFAEVPHRFEAGTPPIAEAVGLGAAVRYLTELGLENIQAHEHRLVEYALPRLHEVPGLTIVGPDTTEARGGTISFSLGAIHPHDIGQYLDELGIAVRVGHHCARPTCVRFGVPATTRASFYLYTTEAEIDALVDGLHQVVRFFG
ncbi:cysteine desulfurase [Cryptosporangium minutisporangium]|uniref:Cysteine desulfurase n=1 Tax=Cryptosporangium minutisporangium TaxID=113569 RepID=A0ABP6SQL6_9ACTN